MPLVEYPLGIQIPLRARRTWPINLSNAYKTIDYGPQEKIYLFSEKHAPIRKSKNMPPPPQNPLLCIANFMQTLASFN